MDLWLFTPSQVVMLACAPLLMVVVSWFERRWGPQMAGAVAAAPFTAHIGLLLVHSDLGAHASHEMALKMSGYIPAQIGVAVVVIALVGRLGYVSGLLIGVVAFAAIATVMARLPVAVAITGSVLILIAGHRIVRAPVEADGEGQPDVIAGPLMIALRAGVSLVTALGLLVAAEAFGPAAGGAIGAFPIFTFTLCSFIFATAGKRGVHEVLAGMVQGLPPYFAFVLTYALTGVHLGALGGSVIAGVVCACCYLMSAWRGGKVPRRGSQGDSAPEATKTSGGASLMEEPSVDDQLPVH